MKPAISHHSTPAHSDHAADASAEARPPNVPMTLPELMLAQHEQDYGHSSTFVTLDDGRIMHFAHDGFFLSDDGGLTWSQRVAAKDKSGKPVIGNAVVKLTRGIGLVQMKRPPANDILNGGLFFWRSPDNGKTWQEPVRIHVDWFYPTLLQNAAVRLASGRIIIPVYTSMRQGPPFQTLRKIDYPEVGGLLPSGQWVGVDAHFFDPSLGGCAVVFSDDDGLTWRGNRDGVLFPWGDWDVGVHPSFEPVVTELTPGGKLLMFMRTGLGRLYQSVSNDSGETWSMPTPTNLAADHSPAALATIPDTGHLICVWNQHSEDEIKQGKVRTRISSAVSRSGGFVWEYFQNVESIYPETRVAPGPIRPCRPTEAYRRSLHQSMVWEPQHVQTLPRNFGRWSYPSLHITGDRALIAHTYSVFDDNGQIKSGSRLKVLPLQWFYGGRDRFSNNPHLDKFVEAAKP